jgi:hypothetical protein
LLNSYGKPNHGEVYQDGDFVVRFASCTKSLGDNNCAEEGKRFLPKWKQFFKDA